MDLFLFSSLVFTASFLVLGAILHAWAAANGRKTAHLPPSPPALPILGHLHLLRPLLHQAFHALAGRYGPLFRLHFPAIGNVLVVSSPVLAKEFLKSQDPLFAARPHLVTNDYLGEASVIYTFLPYGPSWKFLKNLFVAELFSTNKLERSAGIRQEEIRRLLFSLLEKSKLGAPVEVEEMLTTLSGNIIWRMMVGRWPGEAGGEAEVVECPKLVREMTEVTGKLIAVHLLLGRLAKWDLLGHGRQLKHLDERFTALMEKIMDGYKPKQKKTEEEDEEGNEDQEKDLMDVLLKIVDDETSEFKLTRSNIKSIVKV